MSDYGEGSETERRAEQVAAREDAERLAKLRSWPTQCPRCFAAPGQPCFSLAGKRTIRHKGRARND